MELDCRAAIATPPRSEASGSQVVPWRSAVSARVFRRPGRFVFLPRRWVVERPFAWATQCRRLVKDYERLAQTLAGFYVVAFVGYMLKQLVLLVQSACNL